MDTEKTYEEWMAGDADKPIETVEEALCVLAASRLCETMPCEECIVHLYDHKNCNCCGIRDKAEKLLGKALIPDKKGRSKKVNVQRAIYEHLVNGNKAETEETKNATGKLCKDCVSSQMHTSGILWCKSFGNFVHDDGFCYRFKDAKLEEEAAKLPVDNSWDSWVANA